MIAGELPADTDGARRPARGPVDIYDNLIQANLANDDGGGLRFLMAGNFPMNVYNNMIVNNVSTHEGGGIALDDAPNVRVVNNTIMKNITTATAVTSNGLPAPAGLSTVDNSDPLQATLPGGAPTFSNPLLFNNIFWDNRAGTRGGGTVTGHRRRRRRQPDQPLGPRRRRRRAASLSPTNSILQTDALGTDRVEPDEQLGADPQRRRRRTTSSVTFAAWRTNPALRRRDPGDGRTCRRTCSATTTCAAGSPAINLGAATRRPPSAARRSPAPTDSTSTTRRRPGCRWLRRPAPTSSSRRPADLAITKTDGVTSVAPGGANTYTIVVTNISAGHRRPTPW